MRLEILVPLILFVVVVVAAPLAGAGDVLPRDVALWVKITEARQQGRDGH